MARYADRYPELYCFLAGYFHDGWVDRNSFEDVVHDFRAEPVDVVRQATRELEAFLGLGLSEDELHDIDPRAAC